MQPEIYKIFIVTMGLLLGSWALFGYFVVRYITGNDKKFDELFKRTEDLPAIRNNIEWLKNGKSK